MMFELTPFMKKQMSYDPFKELEEMEKQLFRSSTAAFRTDIKDTGNDYVLEAELPGFKKEDIDIQLENNILTVTAGHNEEEESKENGYIRRERRIGRYTRSFDVSEIDTDNITAACENGILTMTLPKKKQPESSSRKIILA